MISANLMGSAKIKVADILPSIVFVPVIYNMAPQFKNICNLSV